MKSSKTKAEHQAQLIQRFSRQLILKGVGKAGQEAWLRAQVQVDGEGPAAWIAQRYLAAAGIKVGSGSGHALRVDLREEEAADPLSEAVRGVEAARTTLLALLPGAVTGDEPAGLAPTGSELSSDSGGVLPETGDPLVVVVGAGGLGCPALLGLLWAGVRRFRVIDDDVVELSNLPRQILHGEQDLGRPKAISASEALLSLGGTSIEVDPRTERLSPGNIERLFSGADLVVEASDNFPTKFRINAATRLLGIPAVIGGVIRFEGQTLALSKGSGLACYRCFFPQSPAPGALPTCSSAGVLGPVAGAVGLHQAQLGMALLREENVGGSLGLYDGKSGLWTSLSGRPAPDCIACGPHPDDPSLRGAASSRETTRC